MAWNTAAACWIRNHSIFCTMTILLGLYGSLALAPEFIQSTGLPVTANACRIVARPQYRGMVACFGTDKTIQVCRVLKTECLEANEERNRWPAEKWQMNLRCLEALRGEGSPGAETSVFMDYESPTEGSDVLVSWVPAGSETQIAACVPLPANWNAEPTYQVVKFVTSQMAETIHDPASFTQALLLECGILNQGAFYSDGRYALWEMVLPRLAKENWAWTEAGEPSALAEELMRVVRQELPRQPDTLTATQRCLCSRIWLADENNCVQIAKGLPLRLAHMLTSVSNLMAIPAMTVTVLRLVDQASEFLSCLEPLIARQPETAERREAIGSWVQRWIQQEIYAPANRQRPVKNVYWLIRAVVLLKYLPAVPELKRLVDENNSNWCSEAIAALDSLLGPDAWPLVKPAWDKGRRDHKLIQMMLQSGDPELRAEFLNGLAKTPDNTRDYQPILRLPEPMRDSILRGLVERGRYEIILELSPGTLREPAMLERILNFRQGEPGQRWIAQIALSRITGQPIESTEAWEEWYWAGLRTARQDAEVTAQVKVSLGKVTACQAETRQEGLAEIAHWHAAALPVLAQVEREDPRLAIRDAARGLLRTLTPDVNDFLPPCE